jgi:hypothetical protein
MRGAKCRNSAAKADLSAACATACIHSFNSSWSGMQALPDPLGTTPARAGRSSDGRRTGAGAMDNAYSMGADTQRGPD